MRKKSKKQMPLMEPAVDHPRAAELEAINRILDNNPIISELVLQDLCKGKKRRRRSGANGMTAEQVLRAGIVKQMFCFSYVELALHIVDSKSLRRFMLIGIADKGFKKSVKTKRSKMSALPRNAALKSKTCAVASGCTTACAVSVPASRRKFHG